MLNLLFHSYLPPFHRPLPPFHAIVPANRDSIGWFLIKFQIPPLCSEPSSAVAAIGTTTAAVVAAHLGLVTIGAACLAAVVTAVVALYPKLAPAALAVYHPVLKPLAAAVVAEGKLNPIPATTAFGKYVAVPLKASASIPGL